jgi:hypothetical protein
MIKEMDGEVNWLMVHVQSRLHRSILRNRDYLEGYNPKQPNVSDFKRVKRVVRLATDYQVVALVYVGRKELGERLRSIGGDWNRYAESRQQTIDN